MAADSDAREFTHNTVNEFPPRIHSHWCVRTRTARTLTPVRAGMARKRQIEVYVDDALYRQIDAQDEPNSAYFRRLAEADMEAETDG